MLVAQQRSVTLKGFTRYGSDACDLMDDEQRNPPLFVWHASWLLLFEVSDDSEPMLVKPGGRFNRVKPAGIAN